ncbi:MAG: 50S ribosomal protein L24 [Nanoarchaeota archaeon]
MKKAWSTSWVSSKQPRKQRKYRYNAPMHVRQSFVSVHLSPSLRSQFKTRSVPARKGDELRIMDGSFKGKTGSVEKVNLKKCKIYVDNIKIKKGDGSEVMKALEPSNLMITKLNMDDKLRQKSLNRKRLKGKKPLEKPKESVLEKPAKKTVKSVVKHKKDSGK